MTEEKKTYIVKQPGLTDIINSADLDALEIFIDNPLPVIAQATIEFLSQGRAAMIGPGVRIVQAALKGYLFKQLASEIKRLREMGRLDQNFAEKKYGFQSWVELLTIIDEDTPDEDRLEAMKAMFYSIYKVNATDADQILGYQLFQVAKSLRSNELLVLKAVWELLAARAFRAGMSFVERAQAVSKHLGHTLVSFIHRQREVRHRDAARGELHLTVGPNISNEHHLVQHNVSRGTHGLERACLSVTCLLFVVDRPNLVCRLKESVISKAKLSANAITSQHVHLSGEFSHGLVSHFRTSTCAQLQSLLGRRLT